MKRIDLNADIAEGGGMDDEILKYVSSANIACAAHAGDEQTMRHAISESMRQGVAVGAHPGYEDRAHFGRRPLDIPRSLLEKSIHRQLNLFQSLCEEYGASPHHVKLHGALYHQANEDPELARDLAYVIAASMPGTLLYCPPQGALATAAHQAGLRPVREGFADRRYQDDASLVPRDQDDALLGTTEEVAHQALQIAKHHQVQTQSGKWIPLVVDSLCIHGDGPHPDQLLETIHASLLRHGVSIQAPLRCDTDAEPIP